MIGHKRNIIDVVIKKSYGNYYIENILKPSGKELHSLTNFPHDILYL